MLVFIANIYYERFSLTASVKTNESAASMVEITKEERMTQVKVTFEVNPEIMAGREGDLFARIHALDDEEAAEAARSRNFNAVKSLSIELKEFM